MIRKLGIIIVTLAILFLCYMLFGMVLALHMASSYKAQIGYCRDVSLPYEHIWILGEVLLIILTLLYLLVLPALKRNIFIYRYNQYLVLALLLNSVLLTCRCFQYPIVIKNTGFLSPVTTSEGYHPFIVISIINSFLLMFFIAKYNGEIKLFVPVKKAGLYIVLILLISAALYIKFTSFYITCFG